MAQEQHPPQQDNIQRVTPGEVRHCLQIMHPFSTVKVRGLVVELQAVPANEPRYACGKLRDVEGEEGALLEFRCPIHQAPRAVQQVVDITGTLYSRIDPHQITIVVRGFCEAVEQHTEKATTSKSLVPERTRRIGLNTLIEEGDVQRIAVIGTKAAHAAVLAALDHPHAGERLPLYLVNVTQVEDLIHQLKRVKQEGFDACVLAQTGSEAPLNTWYADRLVEQFETAGLPIYTALGQAGTVTPADHYADESFSTPVAFGTALKSAIERLAHHQELLHSRNDALALHEKALTELRLARNGFDQKMEKARHEARRRGRRAAIWGLLSGAVFAGGLAWAAQQDWARALIQQYLP